MNRLENFIISHTLARYVFVFLTFPVVAISDRMQRLDFPINFADFRRALIWARTGGDPGNVGERINPAPLHEKWR